VPSASPGGLGAPRSGHFGHCDVFTLLTVDGGTVTGVSVVPNLPHEQGGCLSPVNLLASLGTTELIVGGMGARPLAAFVDTGITVYADQTLPTVGEAVEAHLKGDISVMAPDFVCGGGGCH